MRQILATIKASPFLRHNAILFVGSMLVGVGNYLYYPVMGRLLEPSAFGEVQALTSLFLQLSLFLIVLGQVTVNIVANYEDEDKKQKVLFELEKLAFMLSFAIALVLSAFSWQLRAFFNFESVWPFIILLGALVISVPLAFRNAFLRAHKRFDRFSVSQLIGSFAKVLFSAALVLIGFKSGGAMAGILLAQALAFLYAGAIARRLGFFRPASSSYRTKLDIAVLRPEIKYAGLVLLGSLAVALLSSIDIFVVKHYFDPHTAGEYAGISTVAKIIFFLTGSISQVLLPSVKLNQPARQNRGYLWKSLILLSVIGGVAVIIFTVMAEKVVHILMGSAYATYVGYLPELSLAMFLLSIAGLFISYYLALRAYGLSVIVILGIAVTGWLMLVRHAHLGDVVSNLVYGSVALLFLIGIWRLTNILKVRRPTSEP
jgi:O-antigen/teichoic acid export membrane protein